MNTSLIDLRIKSLRPLITPALLNEELPISNQALATIIQGREEVSAIVKGKNDRLLVIVGPCSIHDVNAALDYASRLAEQKRNYQNELCIVMRVYFEKPRTTTGWKGLINDPGLDNSFNINQGLRLARKLLLDLANKGLPVGSEFLDTIVPQFIADLISWGAIGARTTESQIHRELASGLSMAIGFKNGTDGNIQIAVDALRAAAHPHHFLGVTQSGVAAIVSTKGNDTSHIILRGSSQGPNYSAENINQVCELLMQHNLHTSVMVDCSHGNSQKKYHRQIDVAKDIAEQIAQGSHHIMGAMLESHLIEGRQDLNQSEKLLYGQSITDACIGWDDTERVLDILANAVSRRRK